MITANVPSDGPVALQAPTGVIDRRLNGTVFVFLSTAQSVATVRAPGEPQGIRERPVDNFDGDIFYPEHLPDCGDPMMAVNEIVVIVNVADHTDWGKVSPTPQCSEVLLNHTRL